MPSAQIWLAVACFWTLAAFAIITGYVPRWPF